jgi:hypothetical protein
MNRTEERLADALADRAGAIDAGSVRPLPETLAGGADRGRRSWWLAPVAAAASIVLVAAVIAAVAARVPGSPFGPSVPGLPIEGQLNGVAVLSPYDVWAVGYQELPSSKCSNIGFAALIVHWNGRRWQRSSTPALPCGRIMLTSVAGTSPDNVWAVGYLNAVQFMPIVMHWNGRKWSLSRLPFVPNRSIGGLFRVDAISASDVWAVGQGAPGRSALILHWNGRDWATAGAGLHGPYQTLRDFAATSADDAWAVGSIGAGEGTGLILRWNGTGWTTVHQLKAALLWGVAAPSAEDVWVIGRASPGSSSPAFLHWNGSRWRAVRVPALPKFATLTSVVARSANDVWAVGGTTTTWLLHWDGSRWSRSVIPHFIQTVSPGGLTVVSPQDIWVAGDLGIGGATTPEIMHWNGRTWSRVYGAANLGGLYTSSSCGPFQTCTSR